MTIPINKILIRYGEISLKGKNRGEFEILLRKNIKRRLYAEALRWRVRRAHGRILVEVPEPISAADIESACQAIQQVAGVTSCAPCRWLPTDRIYRHGNEPDHRLIRETVLAMAREDHVPNGSFAVRVKRADKRFPLGSQELERNLGAAVLEQSDWSHVDLRQPDCLFVVEIFSDGIYFHGRARPGIGGLPVHGSGHVLTLLSGGIDSPVAGFLMAKRGCRMDFLHLTASHVQQRQADDSPVVELARRLSRFTLNSRLYLAPYTHFDMALSGRQTGYELVLFRRFMARLGERLGADLGAQALVTGDSLGQVASQTLENMVVNSQAASMPILRPLIGYDKQEIIALARRIDTYDTSIQPYKDCCALLSRHPKTRARQQVVTDLEAQLLPDMEALLNATLADTCLLRFDCGHRVA